jgi:hypothetical protein
LLVSGVKIRKGYRRELDGETFTITIDGKTYEVRQRVVRMGLWPLPQRLRRWAGFNN